MKNRKQKPNWVKNIAHERIEKLFSLAEKNEKFSKRYVKMALEISKKYNATIPADLKRKFCKKCFAILVPGKNAVVRKQRGLGMLYVCKECGFKVKRGKK